MHLTEPFPAGLNGQQMNNLKVYPNPSHGSFQIDASNENAQYSLMSLSGQVIYTWNRGTSEFELPSNLTPGVYLLSGQDGNQIYRTKLMVR